MTYLNAHRLGELIDHFDDALSVTMPKTGCFDVAIALRELLERRERDRIRIPTHRCRECSALWILWPPEPEHPYAPLRPGSWSLFSPKCGPCCDNAPNPPIEPLNISDALRAKVTAERAEFMNFHRLLSERFNYVHDEVDWKRDQISLIECIAAKCEASDTLCARIKELEQEDDSTFKLTTRQAALLTGVVNAIKGEPPRDTLWSHHNAPELAAEVVGDLAQYKHGHDTLRADLDEALKALTELHDRGVQVKEALREEILPGEAVHPQSAALTWPLSTAGMVLNKHKAKS